MPHPLTSPALPANTAFRKMLPPLLSFVSGFVDTIGSLGLFGLLTSQVTGSFVAAAGSIVQREAGLTAKFLAIPMFMVGACFITVLVAVLRRRGREPMPVALTVVAALIAVFMTIAIAGQPFTGPDSPVALMAAVSAFIAMGAESALVWVLLKGAAPTNFMTGNITQVAVKATDLMLARMGQLNMGDPQADAERVAMAAAQLKILLPTILGFIAGATAGAVAFMLLGFFALGIAAALIASAALWAGLAAHH
jgi:uncharacterized membrane protein YoaK (UPF0700 family)